MTPRPYRSGETLCPSYFRTLTHLEGLIVYISFKKCRFRASKDINWKTK